MQKPIIFKSEGLDIYGILHLPKRASRGRQVPAVVLYHGFTGTRVEPHRIFVKMSRLLEKHRIASLRFDFRGCGDSEGDFINTTVSDEVTDALKAVKFVTRQPKIDRNRIGLVGFSLGGTIASYVVGKKPSIKALALWAPAADLISEAEQIRSNRDIKNIRRFRAIDYYGTLLGKRFIAEIPKVRPLDQIINFNNPTLIVHGTKDERVSLKHSLGFYRILKKKGVPVERYLIKGADHTFNSYRWEQQLLKKTLKFFVKNL